MKKNTLLIVFALAVLWQEPPRARAQTVPPALNYQGQLLDDTGNNLPDGNHTVVFRLYSAAMGGTAFWGPASQTVTLVNGRFNTQLDADDAGQHLGAGLVGQTAAYLELAVDSGPAITPRQQLLSAPYALYAGNVVEGAIGPLQLAAGAVTDKALSAGAVTADKLALGAAVTSVGAGQGLKGGPITSAGTLALDLSSGNHWTSAQTIETAAAGSQLYLKQGSSGAPAGLELSLPVGQPWNVAAVPGASGAKLDFSMGGKSMMSVDENGLLTALAGLYGILAVGGEQVQNLNVLGAATFQGGATANGALALGWGTPISVPGYNNTNLLRNGWDGFNDYVSITVPGDTYPDGQNPNSVTITASGLVGINKAAPQHALDVVGDIYASGVFNGVGIQSSRGVALSAVNSPIITRGFDPFDQTAGAQRQGLGRWGLFMEPWCLVLGIPDVPGRYFEVAKYWTGGGRSPLMDVDQNGVVSATIFNPTSDRAAKENFTSVDPGEILAKVAALPLSQWNFKQDPAAPHIGPMGQDFRAAFGLGTDDKHIATVDADGVALAAIQGLDHLVENQRAEIDQQKALLRDQQAAMAEQQAQIIRLERKLAELEARLGR